METSLAGVYVDVDFAAFRFEADSIWVKPTKKKWFQKHTLTWREASCEAVLGKLVCHPADASRAWCREGVLPRTRLWMASDGPF